MSDATVRSAVLARLERAGCIAAEAEADELCSVAPSQTWLEDAVVRREAGEPLAWITGTSSFGSLTLRVDRGVYVPRQHTLPLAATAVDRLPTYGRAADLCTGAGAVAAYLGASRPFARVIGVDNDRRAVRCARTNGVTAFVADAGAALAGNAFDVVTAVAPYVPSAHLPLLARDVLAYEPQTALDGGADGLTIVRKVIVGAARILRLGGSILLELGGDQLESTTAALTSAGFDDITAWADEDGDLRGVAATRFTR